MKKSIYGLLRLIAVSCSAGRIDEGNIFGSRKLSAYEEGEGNSFKMNPGKFSITDYDNASGWNYFVEDTENLGDGRSKKAGC